MKITPLEGKAADKNPVNNDVMHECVPLSADLIMANGIPRASGHEYLRRRETC